MCGIAGCFSTEKNYEEEKTYYLDILEQMKKTLIPRGPDSEGIYFHEHTGLAHTRLSIRDIKEGGQPMMRKVDGFPYVIIYNGELYNAAELKRNLEEKGWQFQTTSDTEVILLSFLDDGSDFVRKLDGIFSFAIFGFAMNLEFILLNFSLSLFN